MSGTGAREPQPHAGLRSQRHAAARGEQSAAALRAPLRARTTPPRARPRSSATPRSAASSTSVLGEAKALEQEARPRRPAKARRIPRLGARDRAARAAAGRMGGRAEAEGRYRRPAAQQPADERPRSPDVDRCDARTQLSRLRHRHDARDHLRMVARGRRLRRRRRRVTTSFRITAATPGCWTNLPAIDRFHLTCLNRFLTLLQSTEEGGRNHARSHDGRLWLRHEQRRARRPFARRTCRCSSPAAQPGASSTASTSRTTRTSTPPLCKRPAHDDPENGRRDGQVPGSHRHAHRTGVATGNGGSGGPNLTQPALSPQSR